MVFVTAALEVHWKLTLFRVLPLPSALFQLPPGASVTTNELNSPIPTVVRSCFPAGLAQPLLTVIAGPCGAGFFPCVGWGWEVPLWGSSMGVGCVSAAGASGVVRGASCPVSTTSPLATLHASAFLSRVDSAACVFEYTRTFPKS